VQVLLLYSLVLGCWGAGSLWGRRRARQRLRSVWCSTSGTINRFSSCPAPGSGLTTYITCAFLSGAGCRFPLRQEEGEEVQISVVQYFLEQYNVTLELLRMPCINAGSAERPNYLPLEVLFLLLLEVLSLIITGAMIKNKYICATW